MNFELVDRGRVLLVQRGTDSREGVGVGKEGSVGHLLLHAAVVEEHADTVGDDDREANSVDDVCGAEGSLVRETNPEDSVCGEKKLTRDFGVLCVSPETLKGREESATGDTHALWNRTKDKSATGRYERRRVREETHEETGSALRVATEIAGGEGEGGRVDDRLAPEDEEKGSDAGLAAGDRGDEREDRGHAAVADENQRSREEFEEGCRSDTLQAKTAGCEHKVRRSC